MKENNYMNNRIIRISDEPERIQDAAKWFHDKWGVPESAYIESMEKSIASKSGVPAWYMIQDENGRMIAGLGVIENDFHKRHDLTPNICAVYVEESYRKQGFSRALMDHAVKALAGNGIRDVYLITTHTDYYERLGFSYIGDVEEDDGGMIRMYHRSTGE